MKLPQSVGFIGGKPGASYYFVGYQGELLVLSNGANSLLDDTLFYLDPHVTQPSVQIDENSKDSELQTYFYGYSPCFMKMSKLDESLALGFFCRNYDDFVDFVARIKYLEQHVPTYHVCIEAKAVSDNDRHYFLSKKTLYRRRESR